MENKLCNYCNREHDSRVACPEYAFKDKCQCNEIMERFSGRKGNYIHLSGCPESEWAIEYKNLPWYKKIFRNNPKTIYNVHKRQTGTF